LHIREEKDTQDKGPQAHKAHQEESVQFMEVRNTISGPLPSCQRSLLMTSTSWSQENLWD